MTTRSYVTHCQGSWKWQARFALVEYRPHWTRDGRLIWRSYRELDGKVRHWMLPDDIEVGSIHNKPLYPLEVGMYYTELGFAL